MSLKKLNCSQLIVKMTCVLILSSSLYAQNKSEKNLYKAQHLTQSLHSTSDKSEIVKNSQESLMIEEVILNNTKQLELKLRDDQGQISSQKIFINDADAAINLVRLLEDKNNGVHLVVDTHKLNSRTGLGLSLWNENLKKMYEFPDYKYMLVKGRDYGKELNNLMSLVAREAVVGINVKREKTRELSKQSQTLIHHSCSALNEIESMNDELKRRKQYFKNILKKEEMTNETAYYLVLMIDGIDKKMSSLENCAQQINDGIRVAGESLENPFSRQNEIQKTSEKFLNTMKRVEEIKVKMN